jgi:HAT1-interacting factor 1
VSISDSTGTSILDGTEPLGGILGSVLGESAEAQTARIEKATKGANDLTNLVKRKKPPTTKPAVNDSASGNGKRKVDFANLVKEGEGKRTRVEDAGGI